MMASKYEVHGKGGLRRYGRPKHEELVSVPSDETLYPIRVILRWTTCEKGPEPRRNRKDTRSRKSGAEVLGVHQIHVPLIQAFRIFNPAQNHIEIQYL